MQINLHLGSSTSQLNKTWRLTMYVGHTVLYHFVLVSNWGPAITPPGAVTVRLNDFVLKTFASQFSTPTQHYIIQSSEFGTVTRSVRPPDAQSKEERCQSASHFSHLRSLPAEIETRLSARGERRLCRRQKKSFIIVTVRSQKKLYLIWK